MTLTLDEVQALIEDLPPLPKPKFCEVQPNGDVAVDADWFYKAQVHLKTVKDAYMKLGVATESMVAAMTNLLNQFDTMDAPSTAPEDIDD